MMSCSKDDHQDSFMLDADIELVVKDAEGNDLLDPETLNAFNESDIKLFYLINGNLEEVYNENMDYPRNFLIFKQGGNYRIRIFLNDSENEYYPETHIQWNETEIDIIKSQFIRTTNSVRKQKIWLNQELIWSASDKVEPLFELIK